MDARALGANITGTQRQILELIRSIAAVSAVRLRLLVAPDTDNEVIEELRSLPGYEVLSTDAITSDTAPTTVFHRAQQVFEPNDVRICACALGSRLVINQLDLIAYRNPGYHANAAAWHSHRRVGRQALAAADRIVVLSRTRATTCSRTNSPILRGYELCRRASTTRAKNAASPRRTRPQGHGGAKRVPALPRHRLQTQEPRVRATAAARAESTHRWSGRLVFAGTHIPHGSSAELERDYLEPPPEELREAVTDLGSVSEPEKVWLMEHASAVVYPSTYEGFGLVPLESALSGVPCVFAAQTSLAEVLPAEAAAIVPWDPRESAARTFELLSDPPARDSHVKSLLDRARAYTWRAAAEATVEIYEEVALAPQREAQVLSRDEVEREQELHELVGGA